MLSWGLCTRAGTRFPRNMFVDGLQSCLTSLGVLLKAGWALTDPLFFQAITQRQKSLPPCLCCGAPNTSYWTVCLGYFTSSLSVAALESLHQDLVIFNKSKQSVYFLTRQSLFPWFVEKAKNPPPLLSSKQFEGVSPKSSSVVGIVFVALHHNE